MRKVEKQYCVYIMTNKYNTVLYTGVTGNLQKRIYEHKGEFVEGFTKRYHLTKLLYYEAYEEVYSAITREKQIKAGSRRRTRPVSSISAGSNW